MPAETPHPERGAPADSVFEKWQPISFLGLPAARAWICSAIFHALAVTAVATVKFPPVTHVRTEDKKAVATVLKIGEKLYFVSQVLPRRSEPQPAAKSKAPRAPAPAPPPVKAPDPPTITPPTPPAREAPRVFAPPQVKRNTVTEATVIQPLSPPELAFQPVPLPSFQVQAPQPLRIPKPFVVPGQAARKPTETPSLPPPPQRVEIARAAPVTFAPRSTLVLPPAPPQVIDARPPDLKSTAEPIAPVGDAVSILSLSDLPAPPKPEIVVPPGNILGRTGDGIVAVAGTAAVAAPANVGVEGARADSRGDPRAERPSAEATLPNAARPPATPPGGGTPGAASATGPAQAPLKPNQMRRPNDGQFDAVVVQNTPIDQFPEGRGLLTGRPIYSVYVSLGTAKDWTLYFCVPGSTPGDSAAAVLAPYPTLLERPGITLPAFFKYVLVHATVDEAGHFQNARIVRSSRPDADKALLAALANWEFRPASREGKKIAVEVLLHVPVDGL